jgi:hypothetical protein
MRDPNDGFWFLRLRIFSCSPSAIFSGLLLSFFSSLTCYTCAANTIFSRRLSLAESSRHLARVVFA